MRSEFLHTFLGIKFWILAHGIITHVFYEPLVNPLTNGVFFLFSPPDSFFFFLIVLDILTLRRPKFSTKKKKKNQPALTGRQGLTDYICQISGSTSQKRRGLFWAFVRNTSEIRVIDFNYLVSVYDQLWATNMTY